MAVGVACAYGMDVLLPHAAKRDGYTTRRTYYIYTRIYTRSTKPLKDFRQNWIFVSTDFNLICMLGGIHPTPIV